MAHDDGGAAFPVVELHPTMGTRVDAGMTLLDWFAGQIAAAAMVNATGITSEVSEAAGPMLAVVAYNMADALIAEKRRRESEVEG